MSPACASLHRPGLTLLEVLVVMAIIGLLAALLLPVLPLVRSRVDLSRCAGQMNQFGGAITAYGADWNGALPSRRMLVGYTPADIGDPPDGLADAEYFFETYLVADLRAYAAAYRTTTLKPFLKCPAMLKLDPVAAPGPTPRNTFDYRYTYQPSAALARESYTAAAGTAGGAAVSGRMALLFCGGSRTWTTGVGPTLGSSPSLNLVPPPPSNPLGVPTIPQFPHGADPAVPDFTPAATEYVAYRLWYRKGRCNVLKRDGSIHASTWAPAGQNGYLPGTTRLVDDTRCVPVNSSTTSFTSNGALAEYWTGTSNTP